MIRNLLAACSSPRLLFAKPNAPVFVSSFHTLSNQKESMLRDMLTSTARLSSRSLFSKSNAPVDMSSDRTIRTEANERYSARQKSEFGEEWEQQYEKQCQEEEEKMARERDELINKIRREAFTEYTRMLIFVLTVSASVTVAYLVNKKKPSDKTKPAPPSS